MLVVRIGTPNVGFVLQVGSDNGDSVTLTDTIAAVNGNYPTGSAPTQTPNNAVVRNFEKWPVLTATEFGNSFFDASGSWITDVTMMKNWLPALFGSAERAALRIPRSCLVSLNSC